MQICPSMPYAKVDDYIYQLKRLSPFYKYFQIDLADGILVEDKTVAIEDLVKEFSSVSEDWLKQLTLDFHFMVKDYRTWIAKLERGKNVININNIFVHFSAIDNFKDTPMKIDGFNVGLALNPEDEVPEVIRQIPLESIAFIQIMSVVPGAQGRPFIPETLNKIDQLRQYNYRNKIYLDGAVNDKTMPLIYERLNRPDVVCPGSFLTKCPEGELKMRTDYLLEFK